MTATPPSPPWAYRLLTVLMAPLVLARLVWRGRREPRYRQFPWQRLGYYGAEVPADGTGMVWIHAVSLGETRAAGVLITALRQRWPQVQVLLTHSTATGWEEGRRWLRDGDRQVWLPWDTTAACRRFLRRFRPRIGLLMETEVWPNLVAQARAAGVPLWLVNARLSARSLQKAQRWPSLAAQAYGGLSAAWAQTQDDAQRLRRLGAPVAGVMGNLKYDAAPEPALLKQGQAWRQRLADHRPVVLLASSREGEELAWLQAALRHAALAELRWLIVPRHPQRFDAVARQLEGHGFRVGRRSNWPTGLQDKAWETVRQADVWLGDSMGEMASYYALADWALMGGSFLPYGGQNLIEALACDCPVLLGPHVFHFQEAAQAAQAADVAQPVRDMEEAVVRSLAWARQPTAWPEQARKQAAAWLAQHRGAAQGLLDALANELLEMKGSPPPFVGGVIGAPSARLEQRVDGL
ncbi:MAG: 3-deoxy-D-manno-octulosonic acid transferase [Tepidimonas sp.]|uniref:3-deoxy-D-manno-octulosonic acid transferase n=1 Tax=Tepidimonas sp. TaxID=2002775 RepID=UPI00259F453A|nr:3-deoxy-D-manno-octulosonic acid transferase [Tepidimonas sp.]MDM7455962.1 3-deoxy-D-manno-octulosonic acid transferase [Tepidimonas sp.]